MEDLKSQSTDLTYYLFHDLFRDSNQTNDVAVLEQTKIRAKPKCSFCRSENHTIRTCKKEGAEEERIRRNKDPNLKTRKAKKRRKLLKTAMQQAKLLYLGQVEKKIVCHFDKLPFEVLLYLLKFFDTRSLYDFGDAFGHLIPAAFQIFDEVHNVIKYLCSNPDPLAKFATLGEFARDGKCCFCCFKRNTQCSGKESSYTKKHFPNHVMDCKSFICNNCTSKMWTNYVLDLKIRFKRLRPVRGTELADFAQLYFTKKKMRSKNHYFFRRNRLYIWNGVKNSFLKNFRRFVKFLDKIPNE
jgi:hypothetical protein